MHCPLCKNTQSILDYASDKKRHYLQCLECELVFVSPPFLPSLTQEKQEYDLHENSFEDEGYRKFLGKVLAPLSAHIIHRDNEVLRGLDFGCGPAPVLANMLENLGISMCTYDPFYANHPDVLEGAYDVITCTEAIEHFHQPHKEWALLSKLLSVNGILIIMTKRVIDKSRFVQWHYKNDPTHVSFFSEATFRYLAAKAGFTVTFPTNDIAIMIKPQ